MLYITGVFTASDKKYSKRGVISRIQKRHASTGLPVLGTSRNSQEETSSNRGPNCTGHLKMDMFLPQYLSPFLESIGIVF
jgi:hypothetical protein